MIKLISITLTIGALFGCAAPASIPTNESIQQARYADLQLNGCIFRNISSLDDGISDASSIAIALASVCSDERQRTIDVAASEMNDSGLIYRFRLITATRESKIEKFIPYVLEWRARKAKTK
jgi:hypothetical protein